jgi:hypothetical protein
MPTKDIKQIGLRLPEDVRARLQEAAERGGRSINAEMARRLEASLDTDVRVQEMAKRIEALEEAARTDRRTINFLSFALTKPKELGEQLHDEEPEFMTAYWESQAKGRKPK